MSGLKEQKCPGCGAAMRYDPELGKMICDYCGTVLAIQPVKPGSAAAQAAAQEKPQFATVIAVGPGGVVDGKEVEMYVNVGDKVIASKYAGTEVKIDGEQFTIVRQSDILATVE